MDEQVRELLNFLKQFREKQKLTDEEFAKQLAEGILYEESNDPCLSDTFVEHFADVMRQTRKELESRLVQICMRS